MAHFCDIAFRTELLQSIGVENRMQMVEYESSVTRKQRTGKETSFQLIFCDLFEMLHQFLS